jgi:hypothetical protein
MAMRGQPGEQCQDHSGRLLSQWGRRYVDAHREIVAVNHDLKHARDQEILEG